VRNLIVQFRIHDFQRHVDICDLAKLCTCEHPFSLMPSYSNLSGANCIWRYFSSELCLSKYIPGATHFTTFASVATGCLSSPKGVIKPQPSRATLASPPQLLPTGPAGGLSALASPASRLLPGLAQQTDLSASSCFTPAIIFSCFSHYI
jgi:hypothetical protein